MLHVGHLHDRRLRGPVEVGAVGEQGVPDHLDRSSMLDLILLASQQRLGEAGIPVRVSRRPCGPGQRVRPNDHPIDFDEQFR